jgi:hypothetical protein
LAQLIVEPTAGEIGKNRATLDALKNPVDYRQRGSNSICRELLKSSPRLSYCGANSLTAVDRHINSF